MGRKPWLDEAAVAAALAAVIEGTSWKKAAEQTGVSTSAIRKRFAAAGLVRRKEPPQGKPPRIRRRSCGLRWRPSPEARGSRRRPRPPGSGYPPSAATSMSTVWSCCVIASLVPAPSPSPSGRRSGSGSKPVVRRRHRPTDRSPPGTHRPEIAANGGRPRYRAYAAQARADEAARRPKPCWTDERPWLWEEVHAPDPDQEVVPGADRPPAAPGPPRRSTVVGVPRGHLPGRLCPGQG